MLGGTMTRAQIQRIRTKTRMGRIRPFGWDMGISRELLFINISDIDKQ
jgi:hypothetical protein